LGHHLKCPISRALEYAIAISYDCHCCSIVVIKKSFIFFITISNHTGKSLT
jgi:hypothetical protein